ncbi:hypothetical protein [Roseovarius sp. 2305UL8-3]|uniref:hypothetical protein n=1 Tax=Roseovarius conchicola TaxID=3121636 RepID=UPI0035294B02
MMRLLFRMAAFVMLTAGQVSAENSDWQAPPVDKSNAVLNTMTSGWGENFETAKGEMIVLGPDGADGRYHPGTESFWKAILDADSAGLVGYAAPTDGVGMSYYPPFTVWFPIAEGMAEFRSGTKKEMQGIWDDPSRRMWVVNSLDLFEQEHKPPVEMIFVIFKLDFEAGEEPGVCHARQVVTILYTGAADETALVTCLEALH